MRIYTTLKRIKVAGHCEEGMENLLNFVGVDYAAWDAGAAAVDAVDAAREWQRQRLLEYLTGAVAL